MIWFLGDNHSHFDHVLETIERTGEKPAAIVFLGDLECPRPFSECVAEIEAVGIECWAIPGNHDTDNIENYLNLWNDRRFQERNLHGRIVEIDGLRVAGLGGVFRGAIWNPDNIECMPEIQNWNALLKAQNAKRPSRLRITQPTIEQIARDGILRKHASTIFYEDWLRLYGQPADILVTHEAPDSHPHGFAAIGNLAASMHVKYAFHGHHHDSLNYRSHDARLGFQAYGIGFMGVTDAYGGRLRVGEFDAAREYRNKNT